MPHLPPALRRPLAGGLLLAVVLSCVLTLWRWESPGNRAGGDTWQYTRITYEMMGDDLTEASTRARAYICRDWRARGAPPSFLAQCDLTGTGVARYNAIFAPRVGFPLAAAAVYPVLGDGAFAAVTLVFAALCGVLAFATVRVLGGGLFASLLAAALVYLLPPGVLITRVMAEGAMLAGLLAATLGACLVLVRGRYLAGGAAFSAGLLWAFACKNSNGTAAAAAALVAALTLLAAARLRHRPARGPAVLASTAAG